MSDFLAAYFSFCSKSRGLNIGQRKLSKEHLRSKAAWTVLRALRGRFQKKKNQPSVFWFFFWQCKKEL